MGKVLKFKQDKASDPQLLRLKESSDKIDELLLNLLEEQNLTLNELIGLFGHRLGNLVNHFDGKPELLELLQQIMLEQTQKNKSS